MTSFDSSIIYLTPQEVCERFSISYKTLLNHVRLGHISVLQKGRGRKMFFAPADVDAYAELRKSTTRLYDGRTEAGKVAEYFAKDKKRSTIVYKEKQHKRTKLKFAEIKRLQTHDYNFPTIAQQGHVARWNNTGPSLVEQLQSKLEDKK